MTDVQARARIAVRGMLMGSEAEEVFEPGPLASDIVSVLADFGLLADSAPDGAVLRGGGMNSGGQFGMEGTPTGPVIHHEKIELAWQMSANEAWRRSEKAEKELAVTVDHVTDLERERDELKEVKERLEGQRLVMAVFGIPESAPQPFSLIRPDDQVISGVGVQWPGGAVTINWSSADSTQNPINYASLEEAVGSTSLRAVWLSEDLGSLADMERRAEEAEGWVLSEECSKCEKAKEAFRLEESERAKLGWENAALKREVDQMEENNESLRVQLDTAQSRILEQENARKRDKERHQREKARYRHEKEALQKWLSSANNARIQAANDRDQLAKEFADLYQFFGRHVVNQYGNIVVSNAELYRLLFSKTEGERVTGPRADLDDE